MKKHSVAGTVNCLFFILFFSAVQAQKGNELLVYAVKGTITASYNNQESIVKIGKVLKPGALLKIGHGASMTMICKQGKPLSVNKEGSFPVNNWRDSCRSGGNSITANYFKYIWGEFYTHSPEHKEEEERVGVSAVTRSPAPDIFSPNKIVIEFSKGLDTLNYAGNDFLLSWTSYDYPGKYVFMLYDQKTGKQVYKDTVSRSYISTARFKDLLLPGKRYTWNISAPKAGVIRKRVLNYAAPAANEKYRSALQSSNPDIPEDEAAMYFRMGFISEQQHYLAEAFDYYKKASATAPDMEVYRDKLLRFRSEFWLSE